MNKYSVNIYIYPENKYPKQMYVDIKKKNVFVLSMM